MKKWWMKGLAVALCAGMLAPAAAVSVPGIGMTVYAEHADPNRQREAVRQKIKLQMKSF